MKKTFELAMMPSSAVAEAKKFVPRNAFQQYSFWKKMSPKDQDALVEEGRQFNAALMAHRSSGLAIGEKLIRIQQILEPYGAFQRFVRGFNYSLKSAYRYMEAYRNASRFLPETVVKVAMVRGLDILGYDDEKPLGKYTEAAKLLPPPRTADAETAMRYVDQLQETRLEIVRKKRDARKNGKAQREDLATTADEREFLLIRDYRFLKNDLERIPPKVRRAFLDDLVGMLLTNVGISSPVSFAPQAVPEEYNRERGRPALVEASDKEPKAKAKAQASA